MSLPPLHEGEHRPHLQEHHGEEQAHLQVEPVAVEVVARPLLEPREGTQEPGGEPQRGRDAPHRVRGEEASQPRVVQSALQGPPAKEDRGQSDGKREVVERGHDRR